MQEFTTHTNLSLDEMLEHQELLINAIDTNGKIIFWNKKCEVFFQIAKEKAIGKTFPELIPGIEKDDRITLLDRALMGQEVHLLREKYRQRSGFYEQRVIPVKEKGKVIAVLHIVKDVN